MVGFVDNLVVGHLGSSIYIGAIGIGSIIISYILLIKTNVDYIDKMVIQRLHFLLNSLADQHPNLYELLCDN